MGAKAAEIFYKRLFEIAPATAALCAAAGATAYAMLAGVMKEAAWGTP